MRGMKKLTRPHTAVLPSPKAIAAHRGLAPHLHSATTDSAGGPRANRPHVDLLQGGRADKNRPRDFNRGQLQAGSRVEREHTRNRTVAREIAMDHLAEDPDYYRRLAAFERRNPVLGPVQPVLPGLPEVWGTEDVGLAQRWQEATPEALQQAVEQRMVFEDEFAEMEALVEDAQYRGVPEAAERHGVSLGLADALVAGLYTQLVALAEAKSEALVEEFVDFFRQQAKWEIEYRKTNSDEQYVDYFLQDPDTQTYAKAIHEQVEEAFLEAHPDATELSFDLLAEVLEDPDLYNVVVTDRGDREPTLTVTHFQDDQTDVDFHWGGGPSADSFKALLESMTDAEVEEAIETLGNDDPYINFHPFRQEVNRAFFLANEYSTVNFSLDLTVYWVANMARVLTALDGRWREADASAGPPKADEIVYQYSGTHDTVAGASARGMYVARLRPDQLRQEGIDLGICVGRQDMGYRDQVIDGTINIYSIRTESGRPKFTISVYRRPLQVSQVKGKANRLPGFAAAGTVFSKEDEVRLVVEFLMSLGIPPDEIERVFDLKAGLAGLRSLGQDPFTPKPVRAARPRDNGSDREVAYWAKKAYSIPMGGKWGI